MPNFEKKAAYFSGPVFHAKPIRYQ